MSVTRRGGKWYVRVRAYGEQAMVVIPNATRQEATRVDQAISVAVRANDFRALDPTARAVCVSLFRNRRWNFPPDLYEELPSVPRGLTLKDAIEIFLNYPGIAQSRERDRYLYALPHLVNKLGRQTAVKDIWIPELRAYQVRRQGEGAAAATINRELSTLSKLFGVLVEKRVVEANPVRNVKRLSEVGGQREAYLSYEDTQRIASRCPEWYEAMIWTAYYSGMRRGEIFNLTRQGVDLSKRIISLQSTETKEGRPKRVPIRLELVSILEEAMRVPVLGTDQVFLLRDYRGIRPPTLEALKNPWGKALDKINRDLKEQGLDPWPKPWPRFHDLRHTWRANARDSGMDPDIAEMVLGHAGRSKPVSQRYGRISDETLVRAVDSMTFEHGETEVRMAR